MWSENTPTARKLPSSRKLHSVQRSARMVCSDFWVDWGCGWSTRYTCCECYVCVTTRSHICLPSSPPSLPTSFPPFFIFLFPFFPSSLSSFCKHFLFISDLSGLILETRSSKINKSLSLPLALQSGRNSRDLPSPQRGKKTPKAANKWFQVVPFQVLSFLKAGPRG